nr:diguanylate cyclase [uncultured Shimia sp.]
MPGTILILDPLPTNRIVLKVKLSSAFYKVIQAASLQEAIPLIQQENPDLVILSAEMPDDAGFEICKHLKSTIAETTPIMMLSSALTRELRMRALSEGADDALAKPVNDPIFLARIRSLMRNREATEELRLRDQTERVFGFAETSNSFAKQAQILFATPDAATGLQWRTKLKPLVPFAMHHLKLGDALQRMSKTPPPDAFVIALDPASPESGLRLLAEIRARATTRRAGVLIILGQDQQDHIVDALDLGANDVLTDGFHPEEAALRLSTIVQRKRLADRLRQNVQDGLQAAVTDPLTGLYNRRYALPHLARIAAHAHRTHQDFAVMIADIDHFKSVNDRFGHAAGDRVLTEVAKRLRQCLRPVDLLARIGGEEFLIVMPVSTRAAAAQVSSDICAHVSRTPIHISEPAAHVQMTVSIGVVMGNDCAVHSDDAAAKLLEYADKALYDAKSDGRNQAAFQTVPPEFHGLRNAKI